MHLASAGFSLVVVGRRREAEVASALERLREHGTTVAYVRADVSDRRDRKRTVETAIGTFGGVDVLVNNAGVAPARRADLMEADEESYDRVLSVNLKAPHFLTQLAAPKLVQRKQNRPDGFCCIVNISSISAIAVSVNRGEYCISKAGLSMVTQLWAVRLAEYDIPVYEVRPGIIETDMTAPVKDSYTQRIREGLVPMRRWGTPEDVGRTVEALCSGRLPYTTGETISVDGGQGIRHF
jgi:NAD(P)-dependent dehydrogenase (short-subunit alcohol dehydrogenase family)